MIVDFTTWGLAAGKRRPPPDWTTSIEPQNAPVIGFSAGREQIYWDLPSASAASHLLCLAGSGAGKTMLIAHALAEEIVLNQSRPPEERLTLLLIDPKGDLIQAMVENLALLAPAQLRSINYLDPFGLGGFPFNLNHLALGQTPLDIRAVQLANLVSEVSTATGAQKHLGLGARQLDVLQHVILGALAVPHPGANILFALDALSIPRGGLKLLGALTNSVRAKAFLLTAELGEELRVSSAARLRTAFAATDSLERLVAAPTCIDFNTILAPGAITVIAIGRPVGGLTILATFYANLLARLAIEHLMERPSPWRGHHCRIVIDEAQIVAPVLSDRAEAILTTGRSRGLSLAVISQGTTLLEQASNSVLQVLLTNTPVKLIGRLAATDAALFAKEQAPSRGSEESLSAVRSRFVAALTNLLDREFFRLAPASRSRFTSQPLDITGLERALLDQSSVWTAQQAALALPRVLTPRTTLLDLAVVPGASARTNRQGNPGGRPTSPGGRPARSRWG